MTQNLMIANQQWANRPADQRYENLLDMWAACFRVAQDSREININLGRSKIKTLDDGNVVLDTDYDGTFQMTHWAFGQLCRMTGTPAQYMRHMADEPGRVEMNINQDITRLGNDIPVKLYATGDGNDNRLARSITTGLYGRVYDYEIVKELRGLPDTWKNPPARPAFENAPGSRKATKEDCMRSSLVKEGDWIAPAGLYASPEDMFAFMVDTESKIDDGTDGGLSRGFFVLNSEVGKKSFQFWTFLYRHVCGNHIVWEASNVQVAKIRHLGRGVDVKIKDVLAEKLAAYGKVEDNWFAQRVEAARKLILAPNLEDLTDILHKKNWGLSKSNIEEAYHQTEQHIDTDGSPLSAWGFVNGLTRVSQFSPYADDRTALDGVANKILQLA